MTFIGRIDPKATAYKPTRDMMALALQGRLQAHQSDHSVIVCIFLEILTDCNQGLAKTIGRFMSHREGIMPVSSDTKKCLQWGCGSC